ncbi:MAG: hypothetical protein V5A45_02350 [Haloarculaceae archaeon]
MSDADPCSDTLSAAVAAFSQRGNVEPGLDVEGEALLQLRKGCRILDGIRALRDIVVTTRWLSKGRSRRSSGQCSSMWSTENSQRQTS